MHLRAPIPLPKGALTGKIEIAATLLIAPEVDPGHPSTYTRSGLEVAFRPNKSRSELTRTSRRKKQQSKHPKTDTFFSKKKMLGGPEYVCREGGHKWEPCLHGNVEEASF